MSLGHTRYICHWRRSQLPATTWKKTMQIEVTQQETPSVHYEGSGSGPDILLVHGLGLSSMKTWKYQVPALSKHFRVHAIDLRGFGKTNNPGGKFSVQQHVYDIKA